MAVVAGLAGILTFATAAGAKPTTTTTASTTSTTTSTTIAPTTTTTPVTVPCTPTSATSTGGPPTLSVDPGTCLTGGTPIAITGSGYTPNSLGIVLQCNSDTSQPEVMLGGLVNQNVPVSCTGIALANGVKTGTGSFTSTWDTIDGVTGPPCGKTGDLIAKCPADSTPTDPNAGNAEADAALYPCPPTPAQQAAGVTCTIAFGDEGGKTATVPITFAANATASTGTGGVPPSTTATTAPATSASTTGAAAATAAPTTAASSGSLAFTGPGTGLYIIGAAGLIMLVLGATILGLSGAPGSLVLALRRRRRNS
jgi:hypothetical protein